MVSPSHEVLRFSLESYNGLCYIVSFPRRLYVSSTDVLSSLFSPERNHGMGDTSIKFEVVPGKNQKSEYVMACGKHTVRGWCKNLSPPLLPS